MMDAVSQSAQRRFQPTSLNLTYFQCPACRQIVPDQHSLESFTISIQTTKQMQWYKKSVCIYHGSDPAQLRPAVRPLRVELPLPLPARLVLAVELTVLLLAVLVVAEKAAGGHTQPRQVVTRPLSHKINHVL